MPMTQSAPSADHIREIITGHLHLEGPLLPIFHAMQDAFGHVPQAAMEEIAEALNITRAEVHGVMSFYHDFREVPAGRHIVKICRAEACQAVGADGLALEEGKKGFEIDIERVAERVNGRCTLFDNLDAIGVLQSGSDEVLRSEIRRQLAAGRKNRSRFIMCIGSPVTPGTPVGRVQLYVALAKAHRKE